MTVLVGTNDGLFALAGDPRPLAPGRVRALAAAGPDDVWAVFDDGTLRHGAADGTWSSVPVGPDAELTAALARPDGLLAGTADARLWRLDGDTAAPLDGFDHVGGKDTWHAVGSADPYVRSLTATADGAASSLRCTSVGSRAPPTVARPGSRPSMWTTTSTRSARTPRTRRTSPRRPRSASSRAAIGGATWSRVPRRGLHATYLRAVVFTDDAVVVGASDGPFGDHAALYRRPIQGGAFEHCDGGLPNGCRS